MNSLPANFQTPPGTVHLLDESGRRKKHGIIRSPMPTADPNDPLNWTGKRKAFNFVPILFITAIIFTQQVFLLGKEDGKTNSQLRFSIGPVFWQLWVVDIDVTFNQLTISQAINLIGAAFGCIFFIPFAIKYGRRPVYIVTLVMQAVCAIWQARMTSVGELYATAMINGLAGAPNETIVQMSIADLFFLNQRGQANGLYMIMVMSGSFLSSVVVGFIANEGDWRLCFWILFGIDVFCFLYFVVAYEESKYIPIHSRVAPQPTPETTANDTHGVDPKDSETQAEQHENIEAAIAPASSAGNAFDASHIDKSIPMNHYRQRLRWSTPTDENLWEIAIRPFPILVKFPVVLYTALQYSFGLAWISVLGATISIVFPYDPYNFSPSGIGLMSLGAFVGCILGSIYGGLCSDFSIIYFARRNFGYHEPEARLHVIHLPAIAQAAGILMFGLTVARGMHWIYPAVASGIFGFGLGSISDVALTLTIDCYRAVTGEAFVGIAFIRNLASIAFYFAINPWFAAQGIENMYIVVAVLSLVFSSLYIPLLIWGKGIRVRTAARYLEYAIMKGDERP